MIGDDGAKSTATLSEQQPYTIRHEYLNPQDAATAEAPPPALHVVA
jgi:hypothetical protein